MSVRRVDDTIRLLSVACLGLLVAASSARGACGGQAGTAARHLAARLFAPVAPGMPAEPPAAPCNGPSCSGRPDSTTAAPPTWSPPSERCLTPARAEPGPDADDGAATRPPLLPHDAPARDQPERPPRP